MNGNDTTTTVYRKMFFCEVKLTTREESLPCIFSDTFEANVNYAAGYHAGCPNMS